MTVETATLISDLNASYPSATDPKSEGDNHIRLIKSALKATFPNFTDVVLANQTQINHSVGVTSPIQTQLDGKLNLSGGTMTGKLNANGGIDATTNLTLGCGYADGVIYLDATGNHTINGASLTANVSTLSVFTEPSITSAANVAITPNSITAKHNNLSSTSDLTIRGAYSVYAPIPEGTVTIPSQLVAQSDIQATGSGKRFQADFSNATVANRFMFQTSTANNSTIVAAAPNGTSTVAGWQARNNSDVANASTFTLNIDSTQALLSSAQNGTGSYLPINIATSGSNALNVATDGTFTSVRGAIGYGTGAGGTVTQATSKSTAVTLNKPSGQITMHNAALAAGASVTFLVNNSFAGSIDGIVLNQVAGYANFNSYDIKAEATFAGGFYITVKNIFGSSLSEALIISFKVIKGANA